MVPHHDAVVAGGQHVGTVRCHHHDPPSTGEVPQFGGQTLLPVRVQVTFRLVHEQHLGGQVQLDCEERSLPLTTGKLRRGQGQELPELPGGERVRQVDFGFALHEFDVFPQR
jgi:hypothetical protein